MNLLAGLIAVMLAVSDRLVEAAIFVLIGIFFDFFDGYTARLLKVQSEFGIQLDSLADVVTSGVVPGIVMFQLFMRSIHKEWMEGLSCEIGNWMTIEETAMMTWMGINFHLMPFIGLLLTLAAAYRLAKFNIDERQTDSFIGLPTPAMTLFIISLPVILRYSEIEYLNNLLTNQYFLIITTVVLSILMNLGIPLFSLKFKNFSFRKNNIEVIFIIVSVVLLLLLKFVAIPMIIILYVLLSLIKNLVKRV